jgi:hypothetical protein
MRTLSIEPIRVSFDEQRRLWDIKTVNGIIDVLEHDWPFAKSPSHRRVLLACFKCLQTGKDTDGARDGFIQLANQQPDLTVLNSDVQIGKS